MIGSPDHPVLTFGLPPDAVAWVALLLGVTIVVFNTQLGRMLPAGRWQLPSLCALSLVLSWGYLTFYLGGAPRIIDATTYLLEARTFADGSFSFAAAEPTGSLRGRFLIHTAEASTRLAPIFPPGYPAVLALGVLLGLPLWLGPVLAAALSWATYALTLSVTGRKHPALIAAALSAICACLRYHTAETMSHGLAALLTVLSLLAALRLHRRFSRRWSLALGLCLGMLIATRQLTGVSVAAVTLLALASFGLRTQTRALLLALVGMIPGLLLLLSHHDAITGYFLISPQQRYYALADGPPGCFGLGVGKGCAYEHADVVARQGGEGLTLGWMLRNTLHRLHYHFMDVAHFEPLVLLGAWVMWKERSRVAIRPLLLLMLAIPAAYSLFYFAGSFPGAGARFYAELIPVWHVFIAWGLCRLRAAHWGLGACLWGFALHASYSHRLLHSPTFGPDGSAVFDVPELLEREEEKTGPHAAAPLVLFSSAHEFNLARASDESFVAARRTHDSREALFAENVDAAAVYAFENPRRQDARLVRLHPGPNQAEANRRDALVFESEFDYPPAEARDVWVHPQHVAASCVSRGRALALHRVGANPQLLLRARGMPSARYRVQVVGVHEGERCVEIDEGVRTLPDDIVLEKSVLRDLSHIDRLILTPTHL